MLKVEEVDVKKDENRYGDLNITFVDAVRIAYDMVGRGILNEKQVSFVKSKSGLVQNIKPILHPNQYFHLLKWLKVNNQITGKEYKKLNKIMTEEPYSGI